MMSELEPIEDTIARMRLRCLDDLYYLITEILYPHDAWKYGPLHKWMCDTVGKVPRTRDLFLLPRDHFKSTILTIGHSIQQLLRDPTQSLLIVSGKDDHVFTMSDEMRRQFTQNERMRALFPNWCAASMDDLGNKSEWTSPAYKVITGKRRREPSVVAVGMRSRKQSKHYNWVYPDDCMDVDDTTEVGLREIRENWKDIIPLIDKDGGVVGCGTRKHYNDLYQAMMDTGIYRVFVRHGLESPDKPCTMDECSRFAQPHNAPEFKAGNALEPARMKREDYELKLKECEIDPRRGQSFFWHEYMNIPFSPTDRKFQPRWFKQVDDAEIPGGAVPFAPLSKWIAVDTAWKEEEHPSGYDFTVVVVGGFDDMGRLFILDILRDRHWTVKKGCEAIVTLMKSSEYGGISRIITEKVADNVSWHETLRGHTRTAGIPLMLQSLTRGGGGVMARRTKFERIEQACQGPFESGRVFFRRKSDNFDDAVNEFCNLRRWTNDDIADAISMFFDDRVAVPPPVRASQQIASAGFHPMPFDGPQRRAAFAQVHTQATAKPPASLEVPLTAVGQFTFTPQPKPEEPKPAFRMFR